MKMKNFKIRTKLLVTFMLIVILFCGTVAVAIMGLNRNEDKYSQFYNVGYQITNKVMSMRRGLQIIVKDISFITIDHDESMRESYQQDIQKELDLLKANGDWLFKNFTGDSSLLDDFSTYITEAVELQQTVVAMAETDKEKAQKMLLEEYQPLVERAVNSLINISQVAEKSAENDYNETLEMQKLLQGAQLGMAGIALVITLLLSTYLTRSITKPLHELEISAEKIVEGKFDVSVTYESKDEMGSLAKAFKKMAAILEAVITDASRLLSEMADGNFDVRTRAEDKYVGECQNLLVSMRKLNRDLSITLSQINQSADQVASGSGQVSNGAQALAQGATEQAASVEELAATITNISHQVKSTADSAQKAKHQTSTTGQKVEECNKKMQEMMAAMDEITRTSNEIGKIIKTISDIAFQTNILALNAAVEASRAGAAGRGFAVVADEVRSLANKSSAASKDTAELIESSIQAVARGTQIAASTAQSLMEVVDQAHVISSNVDTIADAAEEQSGAIEQVTLGVDQISSVVQTNSATSEQSAAASQELSEQADRMKSLVAKFVLREEYANAAYTASSNGYSNSSTNFINLD